jgi:hypothetical protein
MKLKKTSVGQFSITVMKYLRQLIKRKGLILAHSFGSVNPRWGGLIGLVGLW